MSDGTFKIESSEERVFMTITVTVRHRGGFIPEQNMDSVEIFAVDVLLRLIPVPVSATRTVSAMTSRGGTWRLEWFERHVEDRDRVRVCVCVCVCASVSLKLIAQDKRALC